MQDQAEKLRNLARRAALKDRQAAVNPPRCAVFVGATPGVGVSTLVTHVAINCCRSGLRTILIDSDHHDRLRCDSGARSRRFTLRINSPATQEDADDIHELMEQGPAGLMLVSGWLQHQLGSRTRRPRWYEQIQRLGKQKPLTWRIKMVPKSLPFINQSNTEKN